MHDHHDHSHTHSHDHTSSNERSVFWAMLITGSFMLVEVVGGIVSGSLALLADAGHMLSDFAALLLAFVAFRISHKPADAKRSFGYDRFQILAAFINGLTLIAIAVWICFTAAQRFFEPVQVLAGPMLVVAVIGLVVNIIVFKILTAEDTDNLNVRAAALHVIGDLLGSVAAIIAAVIILFTGWMPADPLLSIIVALLILRAGIRVTRHSGHILLEGTPDNAPQDSILSELKTIEGVQDVHHLHVWALTAERRLATVHVVTEPNLVDQVRIAVVHVLHEQFNISHPTVQVEIKPCES